MSEQAGSLGQGPRWGGAARRQQAPAKEGNGGLTRGRGCGPRGGEAGAEGRGPGSWKSGAAPDGMEWGTCE